ncbi:tail fiber domain-containing protein [Spirosoma validum]|uniref:Tail fiber domain-containing protein n=1 Tax=Spirosoma validum TaxID=2771355 RepID=A0A927GGQ0_9BACT|nr:tail fiber domain-containing protein [Spirosoma validum]MBD2757222.1 tail fiber domain-containing protein [Spirosoma validum]
MAYKLLYGLLLVANISYAQVGIGTTTPNAFFNVATGQNVLFGYDLSGSGSKVQWNAAKSAFRAGYINGTQWDSNQLGYYSLATGYNTIASGDYSIAMGFSTTSTNVRSIALGTQAVASGPNAFALGFNTTASSDNATAMGNNVSTADKTGSFIMGDYSGTTYANTAGNQMMMRFTGGYVLYSGDTGNQSTSVGVRLTPNNNAWSTLSDSTRKENFRSVDGASFLQKINAMRLGSWNYKGQDVKQYRHYGPMAQDFFAAFGHDELGVIGEDKSINQADFDGVNLIAIQALIKEVEQLKTENKSLRQQNGALKSETQARLDKIEAALQGQTSSQALTFKP